MIWKIYKGCYRKTIQSNERKDIMTEANKLVTKEPLIENMIETHDFSPVEDNVPEFVSNLLKVSPALMKSAFSVALENNKIKTEINNYIHETSNQILSQYSDIVKIEQENLKDNNMKLGDVLLQLTKKDILSQEQIQIYFATLQQIGWNNTRMAESVENREIFYSEAELREIEAIKPKESVVLKAAAKIVRTPEGQKLIAEGLFLIGKSLYNSFSKS